MNRSSVSSGSVSTVRGRAAIIGLILIGGTLLRLPSLGAPLALDDYAQRAMIEGTLTPKRSPLNLYGLFDDTNRAEHFERGSLPWWADQKLKISFLRPLPSLLIWADYTSFGYGALEAHLHSLFWWMASVLLVYSLRNRNRSVTRECGCTAAALRRYETKYLAGSTAMDQALRPVERFAQVLSNWRIKEFDYTRPQSRHHSFQLGRYVQRNHQG